MTTRSLEEEERLRAIVDSMALVGVHPKPVSQDALLKALLAQNGHYVAQEVVDLMQTAGTAPRGGWAILVPVTHPLVDLPPTYIRRELGEHAVIFYDEWPAGRNERPRIEDVECAWKDWVADPELMLACKTACDRWQLRWNTDTGEEDVEYFAWGSSTRVRPDKWAAIDGFESEVWTSPGHHHAYLYCLGIEAGYVAVAAGRLEQAGCVPLGIFGTRWMFDLEPG